MNPLTYIILFGSVVLGALIVKIFKAQSGKRMKLLIAFSGAYLFAITVLHLIPEIYHTNTDGVYIGLFYFNRVLPADCFGTFLSRY